MSSKINIKVTRSFSIGFTVHSIKLNGLSVEVSLAWITLSVRNRPAKWFGFNNYWNG